MTQIAAPHSTSGAHSFDKPKLDAAVNPATLIIFVGLLAVGLVFTAYSIYSDMDDAQVHVRTFLPFFLLGIALLVALGFEFVNGFHDTANAVATVIYTHSLPPHFAVVWSGVFNFLGVMFSTGAVAFGIISLLPVELILQVGSDAGFAMVFALLIAAILWNVGTWYLGLPASSSHTLIGSIIGVGLANQLMAPTGHSTSGVDWSQAVKIGYSLLLSPLVGFLCAALLLVLVKALVKKPELYKAPKGKQPPPWWIRGLLVLTCTGVSFAHGSNDGQKGMGLIMLILIGTVPTAYALNRAIPNDQVTQFEALAQVTQGSLTSYANGVPAPADIREGVAAYVRSHTLAPETVSSLQQLMGEISTQISHYGSLRAVPSEAVQNVRNDMYLASEAIRLLLKADDPKFDETTAKNLTAFRKSLDNSTKFIPLWVKIAVAIALGLGTMIGWRRIVVTVGEKIGKTHLTYAQGGAAELVAMGTIAAADMYGLPVSTTHVLSSGVAGTMAANKSGLQWSTVRNLAMAWVFTLPAAMMLSGGLYFVFRLLF
ncbi:MAG TPA: inorganic phosphate transporter [Hypericibacter adhaerens]|jgi:PiT family inorganic phosphate transporter|uniref:Phosphate transporter n=1 Tax=Hypericibacter adhaerens TaxID=2602016 RepID=A0A5J6N0A5_9PROT|nr:inorganic phosphate transporter [Hypericibacter adhaerens]QEX22684.1 phosphate transporter [Hypericibacter adhaerens]HWA42865.1 inorganic phosphate transporter [Hypericibacter adhaerens]